QVVVGHVTLGVEPAVEAHLGALATGDRLELGDTLEADDLGPELVRNLDVPDVQHHVIDTPGRLSSVGHGVLSLSPRLGGEAPAPRRPAARTPMIAKPVAGHSNSSARPCTSPRDGYATCAEARMAMFSRCSRSRTPAGAARAAPGTGRSSPRRGSSPRNRGSPRRPTGE